MNLLLTILFSIFGVVGFFVVLLMLTWFIFLWICNWKERKERKNNKSKKTGK